MDWCGRMRGRSLWMESLLQFARRMMRLRRGIGMVHQHFMLAGAMSVLDNVLLGDQRQGQWLDRAEATRKLTALSRGLGLEVDPQARVEELSVGQQQRVEILKALYREVKVLILDEPTAVLTPAEVEQLFSAVAQASGGRNQRGLHQPQTERGQTDLR